MDWILIFFGAILILVGIVGSILPVLPGPPLGFIGLLLLQFKEIPAFSWKFIIIWGAITLIVTLLDYIFPSIGTKKYGGSRWGIIGCFIGFIVGLFFGVPGVILGPFIGALVGEVLGGKDVQQALRPALGSFFGFMIGTALKLITSLVMAFYFFANAFLT